MVYFLVLKPRDTSEAQHTSQVLNQGQFCTWDTLSNVWGLFFFFFLVVIMEGTGIQQVESKNAAKYPQMHRGAPHNTELYEYYPCSQTLTQINSAHLSAHLIVGPSSFPTERHRDARFIKHALNRGPATLRIPRFTFTSP